MTQHQLQLKLSTLTAREVELRAALVTELETLTRGAARAAARIGSHEWADGLACIGTDMERVNEAQDALTDVLIDLRHTEDLAADLPDSDCDRCGFHFHAHGLISTVCPDGNGLFTL